MTDTQTQATVSVSDLLDNLVTILSQKLHESKPILTPSFTKRMERLKSAIRVFEKAVGVPDRPLNDDYFIKAVVSQDGVFQRLSLPDLALATFDGKVQPCFIWHNTVVPATSFLTTYKKNIRFEATGDGAKSLFSMVASLPEDDEIEFFKIRVWTTQINSSTQYNVVKMKDVNYLTSVLAPYVFSASQWLEDGVYDITSFSKKEKQYQAVLADGRNIYISELFYNQLTEAKEASRPTQLILDGLNHSDKDGKPISYRNIYVNGYPRAVKIHNLVLDILKRTQPEAVKDVVHAQNCPDEELLVLAKNLAITPPKDDKGEIDYKTLRKRIVHNAAYTAKFQELVFDVTGIMESPITKYNEAGFYLGVKYNGKAYSITPNSRIRLVYRNHTFDLPSFEGVKMIITTIDTYGEHLSVKPNFEVPTECMDASLSEICEDLGLPF